MSDNFLELLGTIKAGDNTTNVYEGDGTSARAIAGRRRDPRSKVEYERRVSEVAGLLAGVIEGQVHPYKMIEEAQSTSDFPLLFGDVLDRSLLPAYQATDSVWQPIARRGRRRDFRVGKAFTVDGANTPLPIVPQGTEYPQDALTDGNFAYGLSKYGRALGFLWEAIINDDLGALASAPDVLAQAARNTENRYFTELVADATGPDATFYSTTNKNKGTAMPLTPDNLQVGIAAMRKQKDPQGNPIRIGKVRLMVPPDLEVTALNIVHATQVVTSPGATSGQQLVTGNWTADKIAEVVVNDWLPVVDTSANAGNTWYLFADPGVARPAVEMGFLTGHETPEVFMKAADSVRVGGGVAGALDGDFATDGVAYKVRHCLGGTLMDYRASYAAVGA